MRPIGYSITMEMMRSFVATGYRLILTTHVFITGMGAGNTRPQKRRTPPRRKTEDQ